jgi:hypothetical protein
MRETEGFMEPGLKSRGTLNEATRAGLQGAEELRETNYKKGGRST